MDEGTILQKIEGIKEKLKNEEDGGRKEGLEKDLSALLWEYYVRTQEELKRNKLLRMVWLQQTLPQMSLGFGHKPSARKENLAYAPSVVAEWTSFRDDVEGMSAAIEEDGMSFERFSWSTLRFLVGTNERTVTRFSIHVFASILGFPGFSFPKLGIMLSPLKKQRKPDVSADDFSVMEFCVSSSACRVDHLVVREKTGILPVEVKPPSAFRTSETDSPADLVEQYKKFREDGSNALTGDIIRQAVLYMDLYQLRYCIITSADVWYFLKWRIDEASNTFTCLEISSAVTYDSKNPTVLQSLYYLMTVARKEAEKFSKYHFDKVYESIYENNASPGAKRKGSSGNFEGKRDRSKSGAGDIGSESSHVVKETPAANLHCKSILAGGGLSGRVVCGMVHGQNVAIKLAPRFSTRAEALMNEVTAYKQLMMYWGQYIPDLVAYGMTAHGKVVFIATKLVDGRTISQEPFDEALAVAAREALAAIHGAGILHGDVYAEDILVVSGGVRFVDFGLAKVRPNAEERRQELEKLEGILQNMRRR